MLLSSFPSGNFEISIYNSIKSDVPGKWNELPSESLNLDYLRLIEESNPRDMEFRYAIVESVSNDKKSTAAILYFQVLKFTKKNIRFCDSISLAVFSRIFLMFRPIKILLNGNIFAVNFPAIKFNAEYISRKVLLQIIEEIVGREKADVYFLKDMDAEFTPDETKLFGWQEFSSDMTMTLNIDPAWKDFDVYLKRLTKKYRKRAEKIIKAGCVIIRRELSLDEIGKQSKRIDDLFKQVASKQTVNLGLINASDYFYNFKKTLSERFNLIGYFLENKLIAFATYIDHEQTLEIHYIGIDYSYNKEHAVYFNILFDGVSRAISKQKEQLELGRTARVAKANLGAQPEHFNDYIRIRSKMIQRLYERFAKYFQTEIGEQWKERHSFRK